MSTRPDSITRLDYCQYLLSSQINFTLTNFAEHSAQFSHDCCAPQHLRGRLSSSETQIVNPAAATVSKAGSEPARFQRGIEQQR